MATITPGTGSTLVSTTAEAALQEILSFVRIQEGISGRNPQEITSVNIRMDGNSSTCSGSISFPATRVISGDGSISISASPYLQNTSFTAGVDGTFKSSTPEGMAIEVLEYLQILESSGVSNPDGANRITSSFDSDRGLYTGSFTLPVALSIGGSGEAVYTAQEYLS